MIQDNYLSNDIPAVMEHLRCVWHCNELMLRAIKADDLLAAEKRAEEIIRSIRDLRKMAEKKAHVDQRNKLIQELLNRGVTVEMVLKIYKEAK